MGCTTTKQTSQNSLHSQSTSSRSRRKTNSLVRSSVQLEYELNSCFDHFSVFVSTLKSQTAQVSSNYGRTIGIDEFIAIYCDTLENFDLREKKLIDSFQHLFYIIQEGLQLLPLLTKKCDNLATKMPEKRKEILDFKTEILQQLQFCNKIRVPISSSLTTDR